MFLFLPIVGCLFYAFISPSHFPILLVVLTIFVSVGIFLFFQFQLNHRRTLRLLQSQECLERSNLFQINMEKERKVIGSFQKRIERYSLLKDFLEQLNDVLTLEETTQVLIANVNRLFVDREITGILYLFHSQTGELGISLSKKGEMRVNLKNKKGDIYDQWVIQTMQPLLIEDIRRDFRFDYEKIPHEESRSFESLMGVPMVTGHKAIGLLRVDSPQPQQFSMEDLRLLRTVGDLGAVAIENAQLYEHLEDLAIHDSLTGLYVRRYFLDRLSQEIPRAQRRSQSLAFLMIDLDFFKTYNDQFGHVAGDIVLKTVGKMLNEFFVSTGALVGRYGGEEFAVALPDCSRERAVELAEKIRQRIKDKKIILRRQETRISVSIGGAMLDGKMQHRDELIQVADTALYQAKQAGRNQVRFL
ncbi:MAG: sensor domain-containing diguanylate cyclase [Candidatus Omnitrophica bacterium]|nr:sensor domain-containing diguanylate cyclase [Candidatus Omnitrophota bacterium]